jgi:aminoglycoside phosphotransferase (APT) family kinase protein
LKLLQGRVLSASDRRDTLARFDDLCREIGVPAVPAVAIHADLTPMNIVVDQDGRVAVLDFTMAKKGTEHHDLTHVYFHLELLAARHPRRRASIEALQRAMLAGYRPGLSAADPLFRLMLLQHGVCHVAQLAERHFSIVDAAYRWFLRRRWQACVK